MTSWTPTTTHVREAYVGQMRNAFVASTSEHEAEFDQWLDGLLGWVWRNGYRSGKEDQLGWDGHYDREYAQPTGNGEGSND